MGEQQVFAVAVWGYSEAKKSIEVKIPHIFASKTDAINFVRLNKDPSDKSTRWEIHTTLADLKESFSFARDVPPNYK